MDVPILGGGVILLIAAVLWLVYLVPSWQSRHQFNATERNAVRLSQALRILAETSETPGEVSLELDTRTAYQQSRLAKRAEAERTKAERERVREAAEHERELARIAEAEAREIARIQAEGEREAALAEAALGKERARLDARQQQQDIARERAEIAAREREAGTAQARARRRVRVVAATLSALGFVATGIGLWLTIAGVGPWLLIAGVVAVALGVMTLQRMAAVAANARRRSTVVVEQPVIRSAPRVAQFHDEPAPKWTPRELPKPLTAMAGSSAAGAVDQARAREALRQAAREEALRQRSTVAAPPAPVRIETARPAAAESPYAQMGVVSDDEIESHVRQLLAKRVAG